MHWATGTHAQRWNKFHNTVGEGYVYQGRFKAVAICSERSLQYACRYVERNPLRAGLVSRAEEWRWSSLWRRFHMADFPLLAECPVSPVSEWVTYVNQPCSAAELAAAEEVAIRRRKRGRPRKT
jgi:putative transposase